jgi:hypothetical protein
VTSSLSTDTDDQVIISIRLSVLCRHDHPIKLLLRCRWKRMGLRFKPAPLTTSPRSTANQCIFLAPTEPGQDLGASWPHHSPHRLLTITISAMAVALVAAGIVRGLQRDRITGTDYCPAFSRVTVVIFVTCAAIRTGPIPWRVGERNRRPISSPLIKLRRASSGADRVFYSQSIPRLRLAIIRGGYGSTWISALPPPGGGSYED